MEFKHLFLFCLFVELVFGGFGTLKDNPVSFDVKNFDKAQALLPYSPNALDGKVFG